MTSLRHRIFCTGTMLCGCWISVLWVVANDRLMSIIRWSDPNCSPTEKSSNMPIACALMKARSIVVVTVVSALAWMKVNSPGLSDLLRPFRTVKNNCSNVERRSSPLGLETASSPLRVSSRLLLFCNSPNQFPSCPILALKSPIMMTGISGRISHTDEMVWVSISK